MYNRFPHAPRRVSAARTTSLIALLMAVLWLASAHAADSESREYDSQVMAEGLVHPWSLAFLPDGRMLVTERAGRLRLVDVQDGLREAPVSGVPDVFASGQAGLKDVVLAPDFADSGELYLTYACGTARANGLCLARARWQDDALQDVQTLFTTRPTKRGDAHYGGRMVFLPDDTLVLTLGDGFDYREAAQDPGSHIGKTVRLNRDGSVPADNPFVGHAGVLPEIYTLGHRNAQGIVFDATTQRLYAHEHGPRGGDELNLLAPGKNYGWPLVTHGKDYTGARITPYTTLPGFEPPMVDWTPSIAPAGMTQYRGDLFPQWEGNLLVAALAGKRVHRVVLSDEGARDEEQLFGEINARFRDVRTGPDGAVYLLTDSPAGRLLRITPAER
ncbi:PQQ-dependent sugar dehydrogenase [Alcanivorax limicola]|uniref:PQQ-dependent sugar dehydrogenase n=1 Tax=Alcanivorax limicola TaxID=2874102 RepID=UPI001CBCC403|nr:PQQ-dependent sugar dehydrogenase [Alcanivorax limicola]